MSNPIRTPTHLWVEGKVKELNALNIPTYVLRRGEKMDGVIYLKITDCQALARLITQERDWDGNIQWVDMFDTAGHEERAIDAFIETTSKRDPDIWVVEIEKPDLKITL